MQLNDTLRELKPCIQPILREIGAVIIEITLKKRNEVFILSLLTDKPGGITVGECTILNKRISRFIEQRKLIIGRYSLEVSSPGLDRPLKEVKDFKRLKGKIVDIWLSEPVDGQNFISGNIQQAGEETVNILDMENRQFVIRYITIDKAKLRV